MNNEMTWTEPKLVELSVTETLSASTTGSFESRQRVNGVIVFTGRCCS